MMEKGMNVWVSNRNSGVILCKATEQQWAGAINRLMAQAIRQRNEIIRQSCSTCDLVDLKAQKFFVIKATVLRFI